MSPRVKKLVPAAILLMAAALSAWGISAAGRSPGPEASLSSPPKGGAPKSDPAGGDAGLFPVLVNCPAGPVRVDSGQKDLHGHAVLIACSTCHATRPPNPQSRTTEDLDQFHQGLHVAHGGLSCLACHNRDDYDSLRLADGTRVEFTDVMKLCGQCHGPQAEAYKHGAHGGMTGYWDLSRGPRQRNNCIDCHDPHAPAFPAVTPVFPPRDRFPPAGAGHAGH